MLGYIKAGATLEYKPTFYTAKDDMGVISETYITEEEASLKAGIMTFNGETLKKLTSTATVTTDTTAKNKNRKKSAVLAIMTARSTFCALCMTAKGRAVIVGNNQAGWTLAFKKDGETIIDLKQCRLMMTALSSFTRKQTQQQHQKSQKRTKLNIAGD